MPTEQELAEQEAAKVEREALRKERDELAAGKKAADEARTTAEAKHRGEMQQVADYLRQNNLLPGQQQPAARPDDDDPDAIVSRKDLRAATEQAAQMAAGAAFEGTRAVLANQREIHKDRVKTALPDYGKFEADIDAYLDRLDPAVAAKSGAHKEVYYYLKGKADEEKRVESARKAAEDPDDAPLSEATEIDDRFPHVEPTRPAPIVGAGVTARPTMGRRAPLPKLSDEEAYRAKKMGLSPEEWVKYSNPGHIEYDYMDFKGRERV